LKVRSSKGESAEKALLDSGASFTDVRKDIAEKIVHILPTEVRGLLRLIGRRS
jgi:predicted aspartyl protease